MLGLGKTETGALDEDVEPITDASEEGGAVETTLDRGLVELGVKVVPREDVVGEAVDDVAEEAGMESITGVVPVTDAPDAASMPEGGASEEEPLELAADGPGRENPELVPESSEDVVKAEVDAEADAPFVDAPDIVDVLEVGVDEVELPESVPKEFGGSEPEETLEVPDVGAREPLAPVPDKLGRRGLEAVLKAADGTEEVKVPAEDADPVADALEGETPRAVDIMDEAATADANSVGSIPARFEEPNAAVEIVPEAVLAELEACAVKAEKDTYGGELGMLDPAEVEAP